MIDSQEFLRYLDSASKKCVDPRETIKKLSRSFDIRLLNERAPYRVEVRLIPGRLSDGMADILISRGGYASERRESNVEIISSYSLRKGENEREVFTVEEGQFVTARLRGRLYIPLKSFMA